MSDTPHPDPLDEQASDLFDAGADAPGDEPDLGARLDEFRALRDALADVAPAPDAQRESAIAAALALFDELASPAAAAPPVEAAPAEAPPAPVTPLPRAAAGPARWWARPSVLGGLAAAVVVVVGIGVLLRGNDSSSDKVSSAAPGAVDGGFSQAKDASEDAPTASPEEVGSAKGGGSASTAAAAATTPPAAASTTARAAGGSVGATTTAASSGALTSLAPLPETTSTTDGRDVTTTTALSASTTSPPTTTSTNVDAGALPYLGELTALDDVAAALRALPPFDASDAGATIRVQLASGVCDLRPYGTPIAVLRWNGRDSVLMRSADAPIVQLIPLDGCNPIAQLDAPS